MLHVEVILLGLFEMIWNVMLKNWHYIIVWPIEIFAYGHILDFILTEIIQHF